MKRASTSDESSPSDSKVFRMEADSSCLNGRRKVDDAAAEDAVRMLMEEEGFRLSLEALAEKIQARHPALQENWNG